jgi:hypothetical protein
VTGPDGTFELRRRGRALHALGVDLGGPRATLRLLDAALTPGLVRTSATSCSRRRACSRGPSSIPPVGPSPGRASASARCFRAARPAVPVPGAVTELRVRRAALRRGAPAWVSRSGRNPLATTTTDTEGRFTLAAAAAA